MTTHTCKGITRIYGKHMERAFRILRKEYGERYGIEESFNLREAEKLANAIIHDPAYGCPFTLKFDLEDYTGWEPMILGTATFDENNRPEPDNDKHVKALSIIQPLLGDGAFHVVEPDGEITVWVVDDTGKICIDDEVVTTLTKDDYDEVIDDIKYENSMLYPM